MIRWNPLFSAPDEQTATDVLPERSEIEGRYLWRLEDIFPNDREWEKGFAGIKSMLHQFDQYQNRLSESSEILLECLLLRDQIEASFYKLYLYAGLKNDQDTRAGRYQGYRDKANSLMVELNQVTAYIQPEILAIPAHKLAGFLEPGQGLRDFRHYLEDLLRMKAHVLSPEQERLLAMTGEIGQSPYNIFSMFNNADIKFSNITGENGQEIEVTKGRFSLLMQSPDRRVRRDAFSAVYSVYGNWINTLAATLASAVKRDIFFAKAKKYDSSLDSAIDLENIPKTVYLNVVDTINQHLAPLHRYMNLRKRMLDLDKLHPWDLSVPIIPDVDFKIAYPEAVSLIQTALMPLGEDYQSVLQETFAKGWIDVYENKGKRSGAYSWATYGVHPYILLNYNDTLNNMFTIAHELGHALHSYYTQKHQPYHYSQYTIFVAEVASTLNEALVMHHLLDHTEDPQKKLYLLNEYIDQIRGTVYIQALFAEFEKTIHEQAEAGHPLTADVFNHICRELYTRYLGPDFEMDPVYEINWCRIPHFYYNFYVYKYATGLSAATALSQKILAGDTAARDAYLHFLSRGCSAYSIDLLKDAGVDMTSPEPIKATTRLMDQLLDEMEKLLQAGGV